MEESRALAMSGNFGGAVYFVPSGAGQWARLILAHETPDGATDVIRFPGVGDRVAAVPYREIAPGIRDACRSLPVYPLEVAQ